jgi:hypothetical protein
MIHSGLDPRSNTSIAGGMRFHTHNVPYGIAFRPGLLARAMRASAPGGYYRRICSAATRFTTKGAIMLDAAADHGAGLVSIVARACPGRKSRWRPRSLRFG